MCAIDKRVVKARAGEIAKGRDVVLEITWPLLLLRVEVVLVAREEKACTAVDDDKKMVIQLTRVAFAIICRFAPCFGRLDATTDIMRIKIVMN